MKRQIEHALSGALLRTLAVDPLLSIEDAIARVSQLASGIDLLSQSKPNVEKDLQSLARTFRRAGVLSPNWLAVLQGRKFHFYLVNAQPGWLPNLVRQLSNLKEEISHYILYGIWDSLLVLFGTEGEARELVETIQSTSHYDLAFFSARSVPLFYRYEVPTLPETDGRGDLSPGIAGEVNNIVEDWDKPELKAARDRREREGVFLGPVWRLESFPVSQISAYIGSKLYGGSHGLHPSQVLKALQGQEVLKSCLVHLFEVDRGYPFHYFAKIVCRDLEELDQATDAIGYTRIDRVGLEGNTFIVSTGRSELPSVRFEERMAIGRPLDLQFISDIANKVVSTLGQEFVEIFNGLDPATQLILLRSLVELEQQAANRGWSDEDEHIIRHAIDEFARAALKGPSGELMIAPVASIDTVVEKKVKHALRRAVDLVYEKDYPRAQKELGLAHKDIRRVTLGQSVHAFRSLGRRREFDFLVPALEEDWIDRLAEFADERNKWQHGGVNTTLSGLSVIDKARYKLVEGLEILRWLNGRVLESIASKEGWEIRLPEQRDGRDFGIFLSHSATDSEVTERIAVGLRALGYPVWYDNWAIPGGESIVNRVSEGLARNDTLVVLLSPRSVKSRWVEKELGGALMAQLSGQDVLIVPVLIEDTEVPQAIREIKYIDMRGDIFERGFIDLVSVLSQRRNRVVNNRTKRSGSEV